MLDMLDEVVKLQCSLSVAKGNGKTNGLDEIRSFREVHSEGKGSSELWVGILLGDRSLEVSSSVESTVEGHVIDFFTHGKGHSGASLGTFSRDREFSTELGAFAHVLDETKLHGALRFDKKVAAQVLEVHLHAEVEVLEAEGLVNAFRNLGSESLSAELHRNHGTNTEVVLANSSGNFTLQHRFVEGLGELSLGSKEVLAVLQIENPLVRFGAGLGSNLSSKSLVETLRLSGEFDIPVGVQQKLERGLFWEGATGGDLREECALLVLSVGLNGDSILTLGLELQNFSSEKLSALLLVVELLREKVLDSLANVLE
mmetsp:Transcript_26034/g.48530  ORF Transcript_26034/g.48530 Transcript_26034/m.48530 type:complete len:314 (+) Transcript_26034:214-1155(+)